MFKISQLIAGQAYGFLRENPDLRNTIYLTLSGSYAYGTNKEGSDVDIRGVAVEQPNYCTGCRTLSSLRTGLPIR